jgi:hypothetical protein
MKLIFVIYSLFEAVILYHPQLLEVHQKRPKQGDKNFELFLAYPCN